MQHSLWHMYSQIHNGLLAKKVSVIHSKNSFSLKVLKVFYKEGFINGFRTCPYDSHYVEIFLKYYNGKPVISKIVPLSKPGRRLYMSISTLWKTRTSGGTLFLSTSKGIHSDIDCKKLFLGGEVLCYVC